MKSLLLPPILLIAAFFITLYPDQQFSIILIASAMLGYGTIHFFDYIVYRIRGNSIFRGGSKLIEKHILLAGLIGGVLIEIGGNWIFKLWYYPALNFAFYWLIIPLSWAYFFLLVVEGYMAVEAVLVKYFRFKEKKLKRYSFYEYLFPMLGILGISGFIIAMTVKLIFYIEPLSLLNIVNSYWVTNNNLIILIIVPICFLFMIEYFEYKKGEDTLIMHLLSLDFLPLISMIIASLFTSILFEVYNRPLQLWRYENWPNYNLSILQLPLIILIFWILMYLLFIPLYRLLYKKETSGIWDIAFIEDPNLLNKIKKKLGFKN